MADMADLAESAGHDDAVLLAPLTEDTFLHNLHVRYKRDIIYTYVGNALVSLNPCRPLPLYSAELVRAYLARPPHQLPPHLYAITAAAYRYVRDRNESQCIVITGESGAGKTEAARVCLQCAVLAGGGGDALTAAGTLLEAFGNAATARNHNASRFGKLLEIELDFKGEPVGGHITHYLLEKERASGAAPGERNFHVLYQLLAGAEPQLLKRLRLQRACGHYRVLRGAAGSAAGSAADPRRAPPAADDADHFAFTEAAMRALGFGGAEWDALLRVLAFLLKLGNVEFEPQHNIDGSIGTRLQHSYELTEACGLVGVEAAALAEALGASCAESEAEPGADDEDEAAGDAPADWAVARRDRLLCALYSRLFTWLITRVNAAIKPAEAGKRCALAVLDVYGFERLARNGLERLLINYAAERVQAAVTGATLRREQELYVEEGLPWRPLPYVDHEPHAELLDAGPDSVLGALREASQRGAPDAEFLQRLRRRRHPRLLVLPPDRFQIVHYGGPVAYSARGIVRHDRDAQCRRCGAALGAAREPLLAALFAPRPAAWSGSPRRPAGLACRQRALVGALVRRLPAAPRLVRCLRASPDLRPRRLDAALLRRQLRDQGIVDMALLRRAGWCEWMCARGVLARYGPLAGRPPPPPPPRPSPAAADDPVRAARALLRSLPIPGAEFAYGRTRVFIRSPRTVWELEALRAARVERLVAPRRRAAGARLAPAPRRPGGRRAARPGRARGRRAGAVALVVRPRAAALRVGPVAAPARAARVAGVRRVARVPGAAAAGPGGRAAAPAASRVALPPLPRRVRPDGAESHAREGDRSFRPSRGRSSIAASKNAIDAPAAPAAEGRRRARGGRATGDGEQSVAGDGERAVQGAQAELRAQRGAPVRGRLRAAARVGGVAARLRRGGRGPLRGVRGRGGQGAALQRPRGALPGRAVHGRAAAAGGALAAPQAPRAGAQRLPPVAVALRGRPAGGARARVRRPRRLGGGPVAVRVARGRRRARLPVRGRGRVAAARRRGDPHVPLAGAGHQTVPRGAECGGRPAARQRRHRVRGQLRAAAGDAVVPRAGRRGRRAPAAARLAPGRAGLTAAPQCRGPSGRTE